VNLGNFEGSSSARPRWTQQFSAMGFAVAVGVFGLVGVHPTEGRADAATTAPVRDLPVPPRLLHTLGGFTSLPFGTPATTTTTTVPVETTTTTTTTTAPPPPSPPPPDAAPPKPRTASSGPEAQAQVEAIADESGWNWRAAGVRFAMGYHRDCCHWGVYEAATSIIWVGPSAFGDMNRLRYVVLHELGHAWQYRQNKFREIIADYTRWGFDDIASALEAGADCLAVVWGALRGHYWNCTPDAKALAIRRFSGDWR
jgi:hypothetical protein